jgi:hypothetical protein
MESPVTFTVKRIATYKRTMKTLLRSVFVTWCLATAVLWASDDYYAGGIAALATLSADGGMSVSATGSQVSAYKPDNGPAVNLFAGRYLRDYVSIQGNFIWNSNSLSLSSNTISSQGSSFYTETRTSSQASAIADVLVFFRDRSSLLRPYLSAGTGIVHLQSSQQQVEFLSGAAVLPPRDFSANTAALRVAVGIDVRLRRGFSVRYSFSETISANPISRQLSPPGDRALKNFQNLWGLLKAF